MGARMGNEQTGGHEFTCEVEVARGLMTCSGASTCTTEVWGLPEMHPVEMVTEDGPTAGGAAANGIASGTDARLEGLLLGVNSKRERS